MDIEVGRIVIPMNTPHKYENVWDSVGFLWRSLGFP